MAIAIPVATKLVQENQDSRNQAAGGCGPANHSCRYNGECCSGICNGGRCGGVAPTRVPTSIPTTPRCRNNGSGCSNNSNCCSGYCGDGVCANLPVDPCGRATGRPNGCYCNGHSLCASGYCGDNRCGIRPTAVPTNTPRPATPTPIPCAKSGQACSTRSCCLSTDVCTDEGLSYPRCVPRTEIPTYIPIPTPTPVVCAGSGKPCSTRSCCSGLTCTDEGLAYPQCIENCSLLTNRPDNCKCTNNTQCNSKNCSSGICKPANPPIVVTQPPSKPPVSDKCPGAQACPDPNNGNKLRNCTPPDSDGTPQDTLCTAAGMKMACGGRDYCCPAVGGNWTTDLTKCTATSKCTQCSDATAKGKGDANCSGSVDLMDYSIWRDEFNVAKCGTDPSTRNNWKADFNCDGLVTMADYEIWKNNYITMFK